jgi:uncharacterized YigZ family protein
LEEAADALLAEVRRRDPDATHHCWARRIGDEGPRYSDDGEPAGTAGIPILRAIDGRALTGVLVVVTRYYGGTKLGTGGLVRAYGEAAAAALDAAEVVEHVHRTELRLRFAYEETAAARQTVHRFAAEVAAEAYGAETEWVVRVPRSMADAFAQAFTDALAGRGRIEEG